jgi:hypothetical protein
LAKFTIKQILLSNQNWWKFYNKNVSKLRPAIISSITKLLSCKNTIRGYKQYECTNPNCSHTKRIPFTCKSKACSSCGKKATELWMNKQKNILPKTIWQHITLTMPSELWDFFWHNRWLLNKISKIAADCLMNIAAKKGIILGVFIALHTFGRSLKRNIHLHVSTTVGGISIELSKWKKLVFHKHILMKTWRYKIIKLFRDAYRQKLLIIPKNIENLLNHTFTFENFLDHLYKKHWIIDCAKPEKTLNKIINYLSRYIKRPAIAESRLKYYDGYEVTFKYLDHYTKTHTKKTISAEEFIGNFVRHIPDENFRVIRYYGFLANRVRGKLLPLVNKLLESVDAVVTTSKASFSSLLQANFNIDPLRCILCNSQLALTGVKFKKTNIATLIGLHKELATLQIC